MMFAVIAVILGVVVFALLYAAEATFVSSENEEEETRRDKFGCFCAAMIGLIVFFVNLNSKKLTHVGSPLSLIFLFIIGVCFVYLVMRWRSKSVGGLKAFFYYVGSAIILFFVMRVMAEAVAVWLRDGMLSRFVEVVPICFLIGSIAALVVDWLFSIHEVKKLRAQTDEEKEEAKNWKLSGLTLIVVATIAIVAILLSSVGVSNYLASILPSWPKTAQADETETTETEVETETETEVETEAEARKAEEEAQKLLTVTQVTDEELEELTLGKYNFSEVLLDSSLSVKDRERTKETGFSDALTFGFKGSDDETAFLKLEEEIFRNPIYGNTVIDAIKEKSIGDKTIGSFNPWMVEASSINKNGVGYWLEHRGDDKSTFYVTDEWRRYAATLCTWLERLVVQGRHTWMTSENWCLNGSAKNSERFGVPASYQYAKEAFILAYVGKDEGAGKGEGSEESVAAGAGLFVMGFNIHDKRPEFYGGTPEEPNPTPTPSPEPSPQPTPGPSPEPGPGPGPGPGPDPTPGTVKDPADDAVNNGNSDKGGGDNRSDGTEDEYQPTDSRTETYTGSDDDNHHGYSDPGTVTPDTPPVEPQYSSESVVDDENKMNYETDAPTERGPADETSQPTSPGGDGEFTPDD